MHRYDAVATALGARSAEARPSLEAGFPAVGLRKVPKSRLERRTCWKWPKYNKLRRLLGQPMDCLEVLNRGCAPEVEQAFPSTDVARTLPLPRSDVGERMLHSRALSEGGASSPRLLQLAELLLQGLAFSDGNGPASS